MSEIYDPKNPRCDEEQYAMILRCSERQDFTEWNVWRKVNEDKEIWLQGGKFGMTYCKGADFQFAHCEGAVFFQADCKGANFSQAHCESANFSHTHCEGADFSQAHCKNATYFKAHCENAVFWGAHCKDTRFPFAYCKGAQFRKAHCENADFSHVFCEGADFRGSHCKSTNFSSAHCQDADFRGAYCENVNFSSARCKDTNFLGANCKKSTFIWADCSGSQFFNTDCQGINFTSTIVDHRTRFIACEIDDETDFSNSSLASMIVEPGVRAKLEQNIRRKNWEKWYGSGFPQTLYTSPMRLFWWISDYGYSTTRVVKSFVATVFFFAFIYMLFPTLLQINGKSLPPIDTSGIDLIGPFFVNLLQMLAFSLATMVTLGFSNINVAVDCANQPNLAGLIIVSLNLLAGYFLLAVLVTRLGVMFQTLAPGWRPVKPEKKK